MCVMVPWNMLLMCVCWPVGSILTARPKSATWVKWMVYFSVDGVLQFAGFIPLKQRIGSLPDPGLGWT